MEQFSTAINANGGVASNLLQVCQAASKYAAVARRENASWPAATGINSGAIRRAAKDILIDELTKAGINVGAVIWDNNRPKESAFSKVIGLIKRKKDVAYYK